MDGWTVKIPDGVEVGSRYELPDVLSRIYVSKLRHHPRQSLTNNVILKLRLWGSKDHHHENAVLCRYRMASNCNTTWYVLISVGRAVDEYGPSMTTTWVQGCFISRRLWLTLIPCPSPP